MIVFNLDRLLAEHKMQSVELARVLDCTVQTVSKIKSGRVRAFRIETLAKLCDYFDCQPGDILESIDEEEAVRRYGEDYVRAYKKYFEQ